jgi:hypothetical protein
MAAKWGTCTILALCLVVLVVGCRTTQPNLKPPKTAERLVDPPDRLSTAGIRKEALDAPEDPNAKAMEFKQMGAPGGGRMGPGAGGMPYR